MRVHDVHAVAVLMLAALPEDLRAEVRGVKLRVLARPTPELVEEGCEPGEGGAYIVRGEEEMPLGDDLIDEKPQRAIYLFADNITDTAHVRRVLLHELGHACGMDEEEVAAMMSEAAA